MKYIVAISDQICLWKYKDKALASQAGAAAVYRLLDQLLCKEYTTPTVQIIIALNSQSQLRKFPYIMSK